MPKLIDGREAESDSEDWRHECEARYIASRPSLSGRREYLEVVERRRGKQEADRLRETLKLLFERR